MRPITALTCGRWAWCCTKRRRERVRVRRGDGASIQSPELERIISRCLEIDPARRYQGASDVRTDLERLKGDTGGLRPASRAAAFARWRKLAVPATAATALLLVLSIVGYFSPRQVPTLTDKDTIILADFTNKTGDADFDQTLREGLAVDLGQSPFLSLVSDKRIQETLHLMGVPEHAPMTAKQAHEVCERTFSAAVPPAARPAPNGGATPTANGPP